MSVLIDFYVLGTPNCKEANCEWSTGRELA